MSIENNKLMNLADGKVLYDDLRGRVEDNIAVQDTTPVSDSTKIWLPETPPASVQVPSYAEFQALESAVGGMPTDVQINGTSIVSQGVANIPLATYGTPGVAIVTTSYGFQMGGTSSRYLQSYKAPSTDTKEGTNDYRPIVPSNQHESTFYGLAKASGDTTQSASSNAVGTYTDDAKVAIQKMLGIYEAPWELIREDTFTNATSESHTISVDGNGQAFELTDAIILFELPKQDVESNITGYIVFYDGDTVKAQCSYLNLTQSANGNANGTYCIVRKQNDLIILEQKGIGLTTNSVQMYMVYREGFIDYTSSIFVDATFKINKVIIPSTKGTAHYKLFGKRKWT